MVYKVNISEKLEKYCTYSKEKIAWEIQHVKTWKCKVNLQKLLKGNGQQVPSESGCLPWASLHLSNLSQ